MACCIFAAMIITNILVFWRRLKMFLGYAVSDNPGLVSAHGENTPANNMSVKYRIRRQAIPACLVLATLAFGFQHWQHMLTELGAGAPHVVSASSPIDSSFFEGAYDFICN